MTERGARLTGAAATLILLGIMYAMFFPGLGLVSEQEAACRAMSGVYIKADNGAFCVDKFALLEVE